MATGFGVDGGGVECFRVRHEHRERLRPQRSAASLAGDATTISIAGVGVKSRGFFSTENLLEKAVGGTRKPATSERVALGHVVEARWQMPRVHGDAACDQGVR